MGSGYLLYTWRKGIYGLSEIEKRKSCLKNPSGWRNPA
jgi:hypothetical protein